MNFIFHLIREIVADTKNFLAVILSQFFIFENGDVKLSGLKAFFTNCHVICSQKLSGCGSIIEIIENIHGRESPIVVKSVICLIWVPDSHEWFLIKHWVFEYEVEICFEPNIVVEWHLSYTCLYWLARTCIFSWSIKSTCGSNVIFRANELLAIWTDAHVKVNSNVRVGPFLSSTCRFKIGSHSIHRWQYIGVEKVFFYI